MNVIETFSDFIVSSISDRIISKWFNVKKNKYYHLVAVKVRIGLVSACLCIFKAKVVEIKRLHKLKKMEVIYDQEGNFAFLEISIFWVVPQLCILRISEGLTKDGIDKFFDC